MRYEGGICKYFLHSNYLIRQSIGAKKLMEFSQAGTKYAPKTMKIDNSESTVESLKLSHINLYIKDFWLKSKVRLLPMSYLYILIF